MRFTRLAPVVAFVGLTICLGRVAAGADPSAAPSATAAASPTAAAASAKTASVNTFHFAYDPDPLTVSVGTKVTFKNSDSVAHTVTSSDGTDKPAFDSGDMPQNATWSHIFAKAGTYKYFCQYHTYMKGTVIVK